MSAAQQIQYARSEEGEVVDMGSRDDSSTGYGTSPAATQKRAPSQNIPAEIAADPRWPSTLDQGPQGRAKLRKFAVVKTPRSVYAAIPGRNKYRPSQETPISNFVLAGDWTSQKFLGSMEGAVLAGKLAAEVIADRAAGRRHYGQACLPVQSPPAYEACVTASWHAMIQMVELSGWPNR